ncbi:hypothetical protein [Cupriavidus basilensis]
MFSDSDGTIAEALEGAGATGDAARKVLALMSSSK